MHTAEELQEETFAVAGRTTGRCRHLDLEEAPALVLAAATAVTDSGRAVSLRSP